tara:strand:- start:400 stop:576 length:177 start_codon:yes stop_codon:yes gene_type:complete
METPKKKKTYKVSTTALIIAENEVDAEILFEKVVKDGLTKIEVSEASPKDLLPKTLIN